MIQLRHRSETIAAFYSTKLHTQHLSMQNTVYNHYTRQHIIGTVEFHRSFIHARTVHQSLQLLARRHRLRHQPLIVSKSNQTRHREDSESSQSTSGHQTRRDERHGDREGERQTKEQQPSADEESGQAHHADVHVDDVANRRSRDGNDRAHAFEQRRTTMRGGVRELLQSIHIRNGT